MPMALEHLKTTAATYRNCH